MPSENPPTRRPAAGPSPKRSRSWSAVVAGTPACIAVSRMWLRADRFGWKPWSSTAPTTRVGRAEQDPHARGLPRAVDAEERGDAAGQGRGGEAVEDGDRAVVLGELVEREGWHGAELLCRVPVWLVPTIRFRGGSGRRPRGRTSASACGGAGTSSTRRHAPAGVRPKADPAAARPPYCSGMGTSTRRRAWRIDPRVTDALVALALFVLLVLSFGTSVRTGQRPVDAGTWALGV